jgi:hypothetical protein
VFVDAVLEQKRNGTFLDIGCFHHERISNTHFFEIHRGWRGVAVDCESRFEQGWLQHRRQSRFVCSDATKLDYDALLDSSAMPHEVDYLSIDLEPPELSLVALQRVLESSRRFRVITFETDFYRQKATQQPSRDLLSAADYVLAREGIQDDFWVCRELAGKYA